MPKNEPSTDPALVMNSSARRTRRFLMPQHADAGMAACAGHWRGLTATRAGRTGSVRRSSALAPGALGVSHTSSPSKSAIPTSHRRLPGSQLNRPGAGRAAGHQQTSEHCSIADTMCDLPVASEVLARYAKVNSARRGRRQDAATPETGGAAAVCYLKWAGRYCLARASSSSWVMLAARPASY